MCVCVCVYSIFKSSPNVDYRGFHNQDISFKDVFFFERQSYREKERHRKKSSILGFIPQMAVMV